MAVMSKPRGGRIKGGGDEPPPRKRAGKNINVWVSEELGEILDRYLAETRPVPTLTATIEDMMEHYFRAKGLLPSPQQEE